MNVIHRSIKTQNLMIGKSQSVQITDFKLADEIRTIMAQYGTVSTIKTAGTLSYMAPEQWRGRLPDARTDQYALAVTIYEILVGHVPFVVSDINILRTYILNETPEPIPGIPDYVNAAIIKALAKNRKDRYENCKEFIKTMAAKLKQTDELAKTIPPTMFPPASPPPPPIIAQKQELVKDEAPVEIVQEQEKKPDDVPEPPIKSEQKPEPLVEEPMPIAEIVDKIENSK